MILRWMQKMGTVMSALAITVVAILAALVLEFCMSLISGQMHMETIIKCIVYPGIICPSVSYVLIRVAVRLAESQSALRESEKKYRNILANIEDGYFEVDLKGNFTFFNQALSRLIGYSPSAMTGMSYKNYIDSENAKKVIQTFRRVYKTGNPSRGFDWEITAVDGSRKQVDASVSLITDAERNRIGFRGIVRDMTHRRAADRELKERKEKYKQLVEYAPAGIYEIDFNTGKLVSANDVMCEYTGYTKKELLSMNALDFLTKESQEKLLKRMDKLIKGEKITGSVEYKAKTKGGREFWVLINARYFFDKDGKVKSATVVAHDITELKQAEKEKEMLEEQLRQAQKMEAIGTMAGGIAHDFNNIHSVIIGYTELVLMNSNVDGEVKQNLKEVFNASKHARDMVKQILAFSRQNKQVRKPIQARHIIKEAAKMLKASLPETISIELDIKKDTGIIEGDPTQIHQVLMNLSTNAAHAIDEKDGVLKISLGDVELDGNACAKLQDLQPGTYLKLSVSDTGCGIDPSVHDKIFNPYFTTKQKGEGTGLGLAVVQGIVKSHKGALSVDSDVGKGATFNVYLPTIKRKQIADDELSTPLPMGHERILFVDDEQPLVDIGKQMLERLGYRVTTRTSSIEALELFKVDPNRYDLVITDIVMPNMSGDRLASKMTAIRADIPIVLCTGYSERFNRRQASEMGIQCYLMKPLVMRDLADTTRQALSAN